MTKSQIADVMLNLNLHWIPRGRGKKAKKIFDAQNKLLREKIPCPEEHTGLTTAAAKQKTTRSPEATPKSIEAPHSEYDKNIPAAIRKKTSDESIMSTGSGKLREVAKKTGSNVASFFKAIGHGGKVKGKKDEQTFTDHDNADEKPLPSLPGSPSLPVGNRSIITPNTSRLAVAAVQEHPRTQKTSALAPSPEDLLLEPGRTLSLDGVSITSKSAAAASEIELVAEPIPDPSDLWIHPLAESLAASGIESTNEDVSGPCDFSAARAVTGSEVSTSTALNPDIASKAWSTSGEDPKLLSDNNNPYLYRPARAGSSCSSGENEPFPNNSNSSTTSLPRLQASRSEDSPSDAGIINVASISPVKDWKGPDSQADLELPRPLPPVSR